MGPGKKPWKRRSFQFSLRALLVLTALVAVLAVVWRVYLEPYGRQRQTMKLIEDLGGRYRTEVVTDWRLLFLFGHDLQNITFVDLSDCDKPERYIDSVATLPALQILAVGGPAIDESHLRLLGKLDSLTTLVLDSVDLNEAALAALREKRPLLTVITNQGRAIVQLRDWGEVGHGGDREFFVRGEWSSPPVTSFSAHVEPFNDSRLEQLRRFDELANLDVRDTKMTDAGLAHVRNFSRLQSLSLSGTKISDAGLRHLKGLHELRVLHIDRTQITDAGLASLSDLTRLEKLSLAQTQIKGSGLAHLSRLTRLHSLNMNRTTMEDAALRYLKELSELREVKMDETSVSDAGLEHFRDMKQLKWLFIHGTKVTASGVNDLRESLPDCFIFSDPKFGGLSREKPPARPPDSR
jgi:hypothetical protein